MGGARGARTLQVPSAISSTFVQRRATAPRLRVAEYAKERETSVRTTLLYYLRSRLPSRPNCSPQKALRNFAVFRSFRRRRLFRRAEKAAKARKVETGTKFAFHSDRLRCYFVSRQRANAMMAVLMLILLATFFAFFVGLVLFSERIIRPR
jgi:hypothetical protein